MRIHFINVGYGEAILVERDGFRVLIDGGTNRAEEYENPGCIRVTDYLKRLGISRVDLVIITHIHDDHIGGIPDVIRSFTVPQVWINVKPDKPDVERINRFDSVIDGNLSSILFRNALESYVELLDECEVRGIPVVQRGKEDGIFSPAEGLDIELLTPQGQIQKAVLEFFDRMLKETDSEKAEALFREIDRCGNQSSISLRIKAGKTAALLSGDKVDGWDEVYEGYGTGLESQILKLTHHGQRDGMPRAMVQASQPEIFVICSSIDKRFDSAHPDVIARAHAFLQENGKKGGVYVTGCLRNEAPGEKMNGDGGGICAVWFDCNEDTGEISTHYEEL